MKKKEVMKHHLSLIHPVLLKTFWHVYLFLNDDAWTFFASTAQRDISGVKMCNLD